MADQIRQALVDLTGLIFKRQGTAVDIFASPEYGAAMDALAYVDGGSVTPQELKAFMAFLDKREYSTALVKLVVNYLAQIEIDQSFDWTADDFHLGLSR